MIVWFSLVAVLLFGGRSDAAPHHNMNPRQTPSLPATPAASVAVASSTSAGNDFTPTFFRTDWVLPAAADISLFKNATFGYSVPDSLNDETKFGRPELVLCQTTASGAAPLNSSNTWTVVQVIGTCLNNINGVCAFDTGRQETATIGFQPGTPSTSIQNLNNFFLCFGSAPDLDFNSLTCESYSPFFNIDPAGDTGKFAPGSAPPPVATPTAPIALPRNTQVVQILGVASASASASSFAATISSYVTVSMSATQAPLETASSIVSAATHKSKSLSTGALVGIIVGAIGAVLILTILALLCLRRNKKRAPSNIVDSHNSQPEHILLTQPYHTVSESPDLITEKNSPPTLESVLETPLSRPIIPQSPRHSYDSLNASAPYSGLAASAPKRKQAPLPPVAQNLQSHSSLFRELSDASVPLSRGLSDASGPLSPRSTVRGEGDEFEEYHDVPIYGDARHTPTVYQSHPSIQAPFLSEEGMSAEEIARLEEEERRIDAAIAEAEERR